ncbi:heat shock 70 kDa protein 17-like [Macadamia integrifolia]|uniref:heat shock 70 kDa protein 17-like n=1 Tax=Macadamia integrifolia TaxID=60698 RepID=UPI001C4EFA09|nr:heat shock 70 kDa protein 17-like [Macadamia integrifolia]
MKVAVVNLKPGQSLISVANNEMLKQKSPALVTLIGGNRLLGEEVAGIVVRYPDKVFSNLRDTVWKPLKFVKDFLASQYLPFDLVEDSRGAVAIRIDDGVTIYFVEELVVMIISYERNLAEVRSKVPNKDAVITVSPYFGQVERKGLLQAAELAGINVLSLINEHSGAALQYGIDKNFANESSNVIFYDMGSSSTYATLVHFSAHNMKEFGKPVSVNQFQGTVKISGRNAPMLNAGSSMEVLRENQAYPCVPSSKILENGRYAEKKTFRKSTDLCDCTWRSEKDEASSLSPSPSVQRQK